MNSPPWKDLPEELLASIANRLEGVPEVLRFRATCKTWRSSTSLHISPLFPPKLPFPISPNDPIHPKRKGYFSLSHTSVYLIHPLSPSSLSYQSLLIRVKFNAKRKFLILNPFMKNNPIGFSPQKFPKFLNLLDYKVTQVGTTCSIKFFNRGDKAPPLERRWTRTQVPYTEAEKKERVAVQVRRVLVSCPPTKNDTLIFGIYNAGSLFIMKTGEKRWRVLDDGQNSKYEDIAIHNGKCYALANSGKVTVLTSSFKVVETIPSPGSSAGGESKFLVESFGDLFLVHGDFDPPLEISEIDYWYRYPSYDLKTKTYVGNHGETHHTLGFKVYKLNENERVWGELRSMEDRAFHLGEDCRFSVMANEVAGCRGNCIYYEHKGGYWDTGETRPRHQTEGLICSRIGVFNLKNGMGGPVDCFPDFLHIFWPPPPWLTPNPSSSTETLEPNNNDQRKTSSDPWDLSFLFIEEAH